MKRIQRLTGPEKRELWQRWRRGETLVEIGRALGRAVPNVHSFLMRHGGIAPIERKRRASSLRRDEREQISRGLMAGLAYAEIAAQLGRAVSTISREVARNGGRVHYRAMAAEVRASEAARRPKTCLLARDAALRDVVAGKLELRWSPQQIAGFLKTGGAGEGMTVSHETIYRSLFIQARGALKRELLSALRSRKLMRRAHGARKQGMRRSLIPDAVSIRERPAEAEDRAVPGHWEGDLLAGGVGSHIATLVERRSRFVMLLSVPTKSSDDVVAALARHVRTLPDQMMSTLTWDRGTEMTDHARFTLATNVQVYFCDPHAPWQRGSNENTNGLLRQYFPKGKSLAGVTQAELDAVAAQLNGRPRETLGFRTPADILSERIALTG